MEMNQTKKHLDMLENLRILSLMSILSLRSIVSSLLSDLGLNA